MGHFPEQALLVYLDYHSYDETPMRASLKGDMGEDSWSLEGMVNADGEVGVHEKFIIAMGGMISSAGLSCKLLQSKNKVAMLIQHGHDFLRVFGAYHSPLQVMQKNNGLVLQQCLFAECRHHPQGKFISDKGEGLLAQTRPHTTTLPRSPSHPPGKQHGSPCTSIAEIHITATTCGRTFQHLATQRHQWAFAHSFIA